jgi:hypothetical protein
VELVDSASVVSIDNLRLHALDIGGVCPLNLRFDGFHIDIRIFDIRIGRIVNLVSFF